MEKYWALAMTIAMGLVLAALSAWYKAHETTVSKQILNKPFTSYRSVMALIAGLGLCSTGVLVSWDQVSPLALQVVCGIAVLRGALWYLWSQSRATVVKGSVPTLLTRVEALAGNIIGAIVLGGIAWYHDHTQSAIVWSMVLGVSILLPMVFSGMCDIGGPARTSGYSSRDVMVTAMRMMSVVCVEIGGLFLLKGIDPQYVWLFCISIGASGLFSALFGLRELVETMRDPRERLLMLKWGLIAGLHDVAYFVSIALLGTFGPLMIVVRKFFASYFEARWSHRVDSLVTHVEGEHQKIHNANLLWRMALLDIIITSALKMLV